MTEKIIQQGAEAVISLTSKNQILKKRISKSYRISQIDKQIIKLRTRHEEKILNKLLSKINVPKVLKADESTGEIFMEFISGDKLADKLDSYDKEKQKQVCKEIGKQTAKMHSLEIIHSDLTTSNMLLKDNKIFFIDFGLSYHSKRNEDKAVDLHLLKQALEAKHFKNWKELWKTVEKGYTSQNKEQSKEVLEQLKKVEKRGRYKH